MLVDRLSHVDHLDLPLLQLLDEGGLGDDLLDLAYGIVDGLRVLLYARHVV